METRSAAERVERLEFDVEWPPGHVACYLVDGPEPVLVDAAHPDHVDEFRVRLADVGFEPGDVEHVLITHPHVDHIGLIPEILETGEPTIYAPASVRERLSQDREAFADRVRRNAMAAGLPDAGVEQAVDFSVESLERNASLLDPAAIDVPIRPGETVQVGGIEVGAVHTPGHQADHLCYPTRIGDERVLLAGDVAIRPFRPILLQDGLDDRHREAVGAFTAALDRLESLDVDRVYPGHGPVHDELSATIERDRRSLDGRLAQVQALVEDGHGTAAGVAVELAGDRDVRYLVAEAMSVLAHLEAEGVLVSEPREGVRQYRSA